MAFRGVASLLKKKAFSLLGIEIPAMRVINCNFTNESVIIPGLEM